MRFLFVFFSAALFAACTSYRDGVESYWPQSDVLVVKSGGNGATSQNRVDDYVFLQAAQKAYQSGYAYFVLLEYKNSGKTHQGTLYTPTTTTFSVSSFGSTSYGHATTSGGLMPYTSYTPGRDAAFRMFDFAPPGYRAGQYFETEEVLNRLGPKYIRHFKPVSGGFKSHPSNSTGGDIAASSTTQASIPSEVRARIAVEKLLAGQGY